MDQRWGDGSLDDVVGGGRPGFADRLEQWVADARIDAAAAGRTRERWLQLVAEADATFGGVLLDLAERQVSVTAGTAAGRRHHGMIEALGADFVALRKPSGASVLLALRAVTVLRAGAADAALGERVVTTELQLVEALAELASDRARVLVVAHAPDDTVSGELRSVGIDVATVRADGDPPTSVYVRTDAITEVTLT